MPAYRLKLVMKNGSPKAWRVVLIPGTKSFCDLHDVMQEAFDWMDLYPHVFIDPSGEILSSESLGEDQEEREENLNVGEYFDNHFLLEYRYGTWEYGQCEIELEGRDTDYKFDWSTVIQGKGDNIIEEKVPLWAYERNGLHYTQLDLDLINWELKELEFAKDNPLFPENWDPLEGLEIPEIWDEVDDVERAQAFSDVPSFNENGYQRPFLRKWSSFCEELSQQWRLNRWKKTIPIEIEDTLYTQENNLRGMSLEYLRNIGTMLQIPNAQSKTANKIAKEMTKLLGEKTEYCFYLLEEEIFPVLEQIIRDRSVSAYSKELACCVDQLEGLGLLHVRFKKRDNVDWVSIGFSRELYRVLDVFHSEIIQELYERMDDMDSWISECMKLFGVIEEEELYRQFCQCGRMGEDERDFLCFLHLRFGSAGRIENYRHDLTGELIDALPGVDVEEILDARNVNAADEPYCNYYSYLASAMENPESAFSKDQFFMELEEYLYSLGMEEDEVDDALETLEDELAAGIDLEMSFDMLEDQCEDFLNVQYRRDLLWMLFFNFAMTVPQYKLKGYSREQWINEVNPDFPAGQLMELPDYDLDEWIDDDYDEYGPDVPLNQLPAECRVEIWKIQQEEDPAKRIPMYHDFRKRYGDNYGVLMLEMEEYTDPQKHIELMKQAMGCCPASERGFLRIAMRKLRDEVGQQEIISIDDYRS